MKTNTELPLRILTHNIRYATSSPFKGELPWDDRKQPLLNELLFNTRNQDAFICLQEVLHNQLVDVLSGLNQHSSTVPKRASETQQWEYIGVGRDDGHKAGEYSPIFYQPSVWQLRHWENVWLSKTPNKPSKGWDAASIRILTIGVFTHNVTRHTVLAMNTHLDDQGSQSRFEAAKIILQKIDEYQSGEFATSIAGVFLAGDFNSQETQEAYHVLTGSESSLVDTAKVVEENQHYGDYYTWTGFGYEGQDPTRIDYILMGPGKNKLGSKVNGYGVLANRFDSGVYLSDHRAVVADITLYD
ncbi:hypothetical protein CNMCM8980_001161 [Aspergillus fumigatiaffinis]|jgi:endonuclease/exonuclease/phosphatase family metal-dependent hydrolase|uniref:Endonuclease/exonuclease/phosphatase domain-containing protein n=1 Tax=Aspergillus fumigatiaffinis TaxID=340414 RepID=A0A8H4HE59_9EURO|nr:hypothetical protein CNMCM6457_000290 [Aspergillus fumigatiaffinis]KAF4240512.1 hypothetical protein CNMCM8980_001161 [Aspergillus fumigatiaffinis]KAF4243104.1 hypothetical protein CNMCM6805_001706 [Aspergillus fumigatiaffinis]